MSSLITQFFCFSNKQAAEEKVDQQQRQQKYDELNKYITLNTSSPTNQSASATPTASTDTTQSSATSSSISGGTTSTSATTSPVANPTLYLQQQPTTETTDNPIEVPPIVSTSAFNKIIKRTKKGEKTMLLNDDDF
jgi:hypothetical protein